MSASRAGDEAASATTSTERSTLCVSSSTPGLTLHAGDIGFNSIVDRHYVSPEAHANELICRLKRRLPGLDTKEFWTELMEGITDLTGSQYALAVKRILPSNHDAPVAMPELGEPGQCFMATAFFYNDGAVHRGHVRDYKYYPYTGPCSHMKHDKVFVVPGKMGEFIGDGTMKLFAFPVDTYIGVPLFTPGGECIGHFGAIWSEAGMKERQLSWGFVEMALHALEDIICKRLLEGQSFKKDLAMQNSANAQVIPTSVVTAAQSLKPYAQSLSHELRTPMQGVVGMLDIMHATVCETLEIPMKADVARVFKMLRENIEMVQDSSRRAVEAADNVVHAADLDLQVPETPHQALEDEAYRESGGYPSAGSPHSGSDTANGERKRKREIEPASPNKIFAMESSEVPPRPLTPHTAAVRTTVRESSQITGVTRSLMSTPSRPEFDLSHASMSGSAKLTRIRDHMRMVVNECLRYGGRPDSAIAEDTDRGEIVEVRTRDSKGQVFNKWIEWLVDPAVPDEVLVDERDFTKLISVLLLNAIKFTKHGKVRLTAHLSPKSRKYLVITVLDTGTGIPPEFMPNLFKAFSRQDDTITRQSEGLGLGLLVAKGVARRLGGDLVCVRSETSGPNQGSEFELRVPLTPSDAGSRQSSPSRTPTPRLEDHSLAQDMRRTLSARTWIDNEEGAEVHQKQAQNEAEHMPAQNLVNLKAGDGSPNRSRTQTLASSAVSCRSSIIRPLTYDKKLAQRFPLRILVAEDNRLNRKLLVGMLGKLGYTAVYEAFDGAEAVRMMELSHREEGIGGYIDMILMDLWMPNMDGYEAAERILAMQRNLGEGRKCGDGVKIMAVTADVTEGTWARARLAGMVSLLAKPFSLLDIQTLIVAHYASVTREAVGERRD